MSIDNGALLAQQFGNICRNFGSVQWNQMLFRHCSWNAFAQVLDQLRCIKRYDDLRTAFWAARRRQVGLGTALGAALWPQVGPGTTLWVTHRRQVGPGTAFGRSDIVKLALERRYGHPWQQKELRRSDASGGNFV